RRRNSEAPRSPRTSTRTPARSPARSPTGVRKAGTVSGAATTPRELQMTLYLISAWALVLIYSAVIAAWTGGLTAPAIGVGTLVLGAIVLQSVNFGQARRRSPNDADAPAGGGLCEAVSAPAAAVVSGVV